MQRASTVVAFMRQEVRKRPLRSPAVWALVTTMQKEADYRRVADSADVMQSVMDTLLCLYTPHTHTPLNKRDQVALPSLRLSQSLLGNVGRH